MSDNGSMFVKCLSCEKLVRLPSDPDPNSIVRCPRCEETYPIGVLLESEIPELEVVSGSDFDEDSDSFPGVEPDLRIKTDEQNRFIVAPALAKGAKRKKRRRSSSSNGQTSSRSENTTPTPSRSSSNRTSSSGASASRSNSTRRKKKRRKSSRDEENGGFEFFKVVLGALMAPPVAQLVIWWGLQLDPLNLGPSVSKFLPGIVPANFRLAEVEDEDSNPKLPIEDELNGWGNDSSGDAKVDDGSETKSDLKINEDLPKPPSNIENRIRNKN